MAGSAGCASTAHTKTTDSAGMTPIPLKLQALSAHAFAPFGDVLQKENHVQQVINDGHTLKFANLANLDFGGQGGRPAVHIYHGLAVGLPLHIEVMERHPLGSQAFMPLQERPFLVIVAPASAAPRPAEVRGFFTNGRQGVNLHKGVWHHYQITLGEPADYLVIDRVGPGENFQQHRLEQSLILAHLPW
jgi:ureidoglycolate lyase